MNTRRGLLLVLVLIVLIAGGFILFNRRPAIAPTIQKQTAATPTPGLPKETTVRYTTNGFSPQEVHIKVGNAVRWTNETADTATVNSDDHPTHRKFPEMNLGEFQKDQTLVHVFTKPGKYTYHNHLNPSQKGTVVVE